MSGRAGYGERMACPATPLPNPAPPPPDPQAIRTSLTPARAAEFDHEWDIVLERAKQSKDLDAPRGALAGG